MKILRSTGLKTLMNIILRFFVIVLLSFLSVFIYSYLFEKDKIAVDKYNFVQLKKIKLILDNNSLSGQKFFSLNEFNKIYNKDIQPKESCYYVSNSNGGEKYIIGFQLESLIYRFFYFGRTYVYPRYDLPNDYVCTGGNRCDYDYMFWRFYKTISNPCEE